MGHTETELAWIAGFYEGEGTICLKRDRRGYVLLAVSISQKDVTPLEFIRSRFGGYLQYKTNRKSSYGREPINIWSLVSKQAREFAAAIRPYMKSRYKIAQLESALAKERGVVDPNYRTNAPRRSNGTFLPKVQNVA